MYVSEMSTGITPAKRSLSLGGRVSTMGGTAGRKAGREENKVDSREAIRIDLLWLFTCCCTLRHTRIVSPPSLHRIVRAARRDGIVPGLAIHQRWRGS